MNILEKARPENSFRCSDGTVLSSVYELENRLCTMSSETFYHHVNYSGNDFHNWVRDVFQDLELANELLSAKTPAAAATIVRKHLRKALLAKEEIEDAIRDFSAANRTRITRAATATKKAQPQPKKTAKQHNRKNRKLNKKRSNKNNKSGKSSSSDNGYRNHNRARHSRNKRGKSAHKRAKKQVNKWLNWLKIVPEL